VVIYRPQKPLVLISIPFKFMYPAVLIKISVRTQMAVINYAANHG